MLYFALQSTCAVIQYDLVWILYILDYNFSIFFLLKLLELLDEFSPSTTKSCSLEGQTKFVIINGEVCEKFMKRENREECPRKIHVA